MSTKFTGMGEDSREYANKGARQGMPTKFTLTTLFTLKLFYSVFLQLVEEGPVADLKELRRVGPVAAGFFQRLPDHFPFQLFRGALDGKRLYCHVERRLARHSRRAPSSQLVRQTARIQDIAVAEEQHPLDAVFELPDVAGPAILHEGLHHGRRAVHPLLFQGGAILFQEMGEQQGDVFQPFPERGNQNGKNVEPEIEVLPEPGTGDLFLQVFGGCGDHPDIDLFQNRSADPPDLLLLQYAKQLDLEGEGHFADLVQKQGAAVGLFEQPDLVRRGIGECALDMAEQLRLQKVLRDRPAVDRHKRGVLAPAVVMKRPGDQLLAGPRLTQDQDCRLEVADLFHQ